MVRVVPRGPCDYTPRTSLFERTDTCLPGSCKSYKVLVGMEIHVQLATRRKMFTGAAQRVRRRAQLAGGRAGARAAGDAAGDEQAGGRVLDQGGAGAGVQDREAHEVGSQELLLPGPAEELPDQPVRPAAVLRGDVRDRRARTGSRKTVRIRRAHLEEDAGKLLHEAPGGYRDRSLDRRSEPRGHAAAGDRDRAGFVEPEGRGDVRAGAAEARAVPRACPKAQMQMGHMRFEPNINVHITDQDGNVHKTAITEIKNLNSFSRAGAGDGVRDPAADSRVGGDRDRSGKKSTYGWDEAQRQHVPPARQGGGAATTAISPIRTWCRWRWATRG